MCPLAGTILEVGSCLWSFFRTIVSWFLTVALEAFSATPYKALECPFDARFRSNECETWTFCFFFCEPFLFLSFQLVCLFWAIRDGTLWFRSHSGRGLQSRSGTACGCGLGHWTGDRSPSCFSAFSSLLFIVFLMIASFDQVVHVWCTSLLVPRRRLPCGGVSYCGATNEIVLVDGEV